MVIKKNKKAQLGHAVTWIHKFLILVLVVGGTVGIVAGHYSRQYDIRDVESTILTDNLVECIAPNGIIKEFNEDAIKKCLPFDEKEVFINITLGDNSISFGDDFLKVLCETKSKKIKIKYPPSCLEEKYYVLKDNEAKELIIFLAIKKIEKNL